MSKKKEDLFEKIRSAEVLTEEEIQFLSEAPDYDAMFSMYGEKQPREKNINRVIAGLQAFNTANPEHSSTPALPGVQPSVAGASGRQMQIMELQIKKLLSDQKELHNRYVSLIRSQNQLITRNNEISKRLAEITKLIENTDRY